MRLLHFDLLVLNASVVPGVFGSVAVAVVEATVVAVVGVVTLATVGVVTSVTAGVVVEASVVPVVDSVVEFPARVVTSVTAGLVALVELTVDVAASAEMSKRLFVSLTCRLYAEKIHTALISGLWRVSPWQRCCSRTRELRDSFQKSNTLCCRFGSQQILPNSNVTSHISRLSQRSNQTHLLCSHKAPSAATPSGTKSALAAGCISHRQQQARCDLL